MVDRPSSPVEVDNSTESPNAPVPDPVRVKAHVFDGVIVLLAEVLAILCLLLDGPLGINMRTEIFDAVIALAILVGLGTGTQLLMLIVWGQTLGMRMEDMRWVREATGRPSAVHAVFKWLLQMVLAVISVGLLTIVFSLLTKDDQGRTVFDRMFGLRAVRVERGPSPAAAVLAQAQAREGEDGAREYVLRIDGQASPRPEQNEEPETPRTQIGEPKQPAAPRVGESQWAFKAPPSALDLAQLGHTIINSRTYGDVGLPLSDVNELTDLERSMGVRPRGSVRLVFDDGTRYDLVGSLLIGRDPVAEGPFANAALLAVSDTARSVSKIHIIVRVRDEQVYVEDLFSTNGTKLSLPDGTIVPLKPGVETHVAAGVMVIFGRRRMLVSG